MALVVCARRTWVRVLGVLYPVVTVLVIVGTANHFVVDAVAGAAVLGFGFGVQYVLFGRAAFRQAPLPPDGDESSTDIPDLVDRGEPSSQVGVSVETGVASSS